MKKILLVELGIIILLSGSCTYIKERKINIAIKKIEQSGFDRNFWLSDTLGCNSEKKTHSATLLEKSNILNDFTKDEVLKLLEKPYRVKSDDTNIRFFYIIDGKLMCDNLKAKGIMRSDENSYLVISFNGKGEYSNLTTIIP